jgi:tRNA dimethylallyltransferase
VIHQPRPQAMLIALFGPTSSGKTRLSVELAGRIRRDLGVEPVIISADSRQVYKYMNLGTSKTTPEQMRGIRHEMIDVTEPVRKLELESYAKLAREHIAECHRVGRLPFVVGGTGTHVNALLGGWEVDQIGVARTSLRRHFPRALAADAYQTLRRLDRGAAARVHPNNYEGIIDALAMAMSGRHARPSAGPGQAHQVVLGLDPGQSGLDKRVARTYDDQVRAGLYDEICSLADRYGLDEEMRRHGRKSQNQVLHTHGYRSSSSWPPSMQAGRRPQRE